MHFEQATTTHVFSFKKPVSHGPLKLQRVIVQLLRREKCSKAIKKTLKFKKKMYNTTYIIARKLECKSWSLIAVACRIMGKLVYCTCCSVQLSALR